MSKRFKIDQKDYHMNNRCRTSSLSTERYCYNTFKEIKNLAKRIQEYKNSIKIQEFRVRSMTRDLTALEKNIKQFVNSDGFVKSRTSPEYKSLSMRLKEEKAKLFADREFLFDLFILVKDFGLKHEVLSS